MTFSSSIGAIKKWVELQNSGDNLIVMLADLHAITIPREPEALRYDEKFDRYQMKKKNNENLENPFWKLPLR